MNPQEQIKALAELDGHNMAQCMCKLGFSHPVAAHASLSNGKVPRYLTSYDAIIPLVQKFNDVIILQVIHVLGETGLKKSFQILKVTPSQLSEALLRAAGKWKEGE